MFRAKRTLTGLLVLALGLNAHGAGFGRVKATAWIGQPLDFAVQLNGLDADQAQASCVRAVVVQGQDRMASDRVKVSVQQRGGEWWAVVRTVGPVEEPILNVHVSLSCGQQVSRSLVVFAEPPPVDLPVAQVSMGGPSESGQVPQALSAALADRVAGTPDVAARGRKSRGLKPGDAAPPKSAASAPARLASTPVSGPSAPLKLSGVQGRSVRTQDRLSLSPDLGERSIGDYQISSILSEVSASSPVTERDREALREHFRAMARDPLETQRELVALQREVATLKASAASAQASEPSGASVPSLWLGALGLLALAGMGWGAWSYRQLRKEREAAWWAQASHFPEPEQVSADELPSVQPVDPSPLQTQEGGIVIRGVEPTQQDQFVVGLSTEMQPAREVSVEELIDLEQQAEFFIALGQHDAAIDLLVAHLRSGAGSSPLPYMKLMELYQLRGEREAYDRIRARFNTRFNAHAPDWSSDLSKGRTLEGYPQVVERLQRLWPHPHLAMEVLQSSLMRTDTSSEAFDLPAYGELLMLYGVATDLASTAGVPADSDVDIPLPLGDERGVPASAATATPFSQSMMAPLEAEGAVRSDWVDSEPAAVTPSGWSLEPMPGSAIEESVSALATQALPLDDGQAASQASQPAVLTTLDFQTEPMPLPDAKEAPNPGFTVSEFPFDVLGLEVVTPEPAGGVERQARPPEPGPAAAPAAQAVQGFSSLHIDLPLDGEDLTRH